MIAAAAIVFCVLIGRLWYLQITSGEQYVAASESTYLHQIALPAPRGLILDSQRKPVATNRPSYDVVVTPAFLPKAKPFLRKLGTVLELGDEELKVLDERAEDAALRAKSVNDLPTVRLKAGLTPEQEQRILDAGLDHEGVEVRTDAAGARDAYLTLRQYPSRMRVLRLLQEFLAIKPGRFETISKHVMAAKGLDMFEEIRILVDIGQEELHVLENNRELLPGVKVQPATHRLYPYGDRAAHALGYTKEITQAELDKLKEHGYKLGDYIGKIGIERLFENTLRGVNGEEWVVVNSKGVPQTDEQSRELLPERDHRDAVPGNSIVLSLDIELTEAATEAIALHPVGAVVALEPKTGFLLAMASKPSVDLNRLASRITKDELAELETNPLKPLVSKPLMETYAPGSTFKLFTGIAALDKHKVTPQQRFGCGGSLWFGRRFGCHKRSGHGSMDFVHGLAHSCDVYFYNLGMRAGLDELQKVAHRYGFGEKTGLGFQESPGFIPNKAFYRAQNNGYYPAGQDLNNAIGQGDVKVTMLQLALAYGAVANGGHLLKPQIVRRIESADGRVVKEFEPALRRNTGLTPAMHKLLVTGLNSVTNAPFGTAYWLRLREYKVAGKTGSAQHLHNSIKKVWQQTWDERDDAVFVGFSPPENPEIIAAAIIPHGGHGASVAMPVVNTVIKAFFDLKAARAAAQNQTSALETDKTLSSTAK
jgi:penicillin-binding protein 2